MNKSEMTGRLQWLTTTLANQRVELSKMLLRLKDLGLSATGGFDLHRKFTRLMEQVATDRDKELEILHEIETVEKRHLEMKQRHMLRHAEPEKPADKIPAADLAPAEEEPKRMSFFTLFGLLALFASKPIKHKNQDLTVD